MPKTYNTQPVQTALQTAKNALILLPQNPTLDTVAAGLSLYLSLTKKPLPVTIGCASQMTVGFNRLFGVDKIKPRIGNQNLVISFAYPEDSLEKVSYDKDPANQKFNLTIEPKAGMQPLDVSQVEYSYTGCQADLIFVIGARTLEDLGQLYHDEKKLFEDKTKTLVNLSSLDKNSQFGTVNLYDPTAIGPSEIVYSVIQSLGLSLDADLATNLLAGIESASNNFSSPQVTADTFDTVAQLLRLGAKKGQLTIPSMMPPRFSSPLGSPYNQFAAPAQPFRPQPISPMTPFTSPAAPAAASGVGATPSPDWLKPKVFTSTNSNPQI